MDWAESEFQIFADIDEERIWPEIKIQIEGGAFRSAFKLNNLIKHVSPAHQSEFVSLWLGQGINDSWYFNYVLDIVLELQIENATRLIFLQQLKQQAKDYRGSFRERDSFLSKIQTAIRSFSPIKDR